MSQVFFLFFFCPFFSSITSTGLSCSRMIFPAHTGQEAVYQQSITGLTPIDRHYLIYDYSQFRVLTSPNQHVFALWEKTDKDGGGGVSFLRSLRRKARIRSQLAGGFKPFLHRYAVSYLSPPTFSISLTKYDTSAWPFWSVILLYISLYCNSVSSIYL